MLVGFDGKRALKNYTGLGNYSRYVLQALVKYFPQNVYSVYSVNPPERALKSNLSSVIFKHLEGKKLAGLWRTFSIVDDLKRDGVEIYHGLSNEIPVGLSKSGIASIVTIHDLIFLRYPHFYRLIDRYIYYYKSKYACKNADHIIAISEQTKRDIIHYFMFTDLKISVIYQNCDPAFQEKFTPESKEEIRRFYKLPAKFILNVGTIEPRKNLMLLAKALKTVSEEIHLVVVGKDTPYASKVRDYLQTNKLTHRIHFLKNVPLKDLPGIYQLADLFVFPSKFEGFGIPIIEALHSSVPVIAASGSCLEEAGGPDSLYINPADATELAKKILEILNDPTTKKRMIDKGLEYVNNFNDHAFAATLIDIYQKTIDHAKRRN